MRTAPRQPGFGSLYLLRFSVAQWHIRDVDSSVPPAIARQWLFSPRELLWVCGVQRIILRCHIPSPEADYPWSLAKVAPLYHLHYVSSSLDFLGLSELQLGKECLRGDLLCGPPRFSSERSPLTPNRLQGTCGSLALFTCTLEFPLRLLQLLFLLFAPRLLTPAQIFDDS